MLQTLLYDDQRRSLMAEAARIAGKPNAASDIAAEIVSLIAPSSR
jgi:hypothetical protein